MARAGNGDMTRLKTSFLPFVTCTFVSETRVVVGGHDCCPMLFSDEGAECNVQFVAKLDSAKKQSATKFS